MSVHLRVLAAATALGLLAATPASSFVRRTIFIDGWVDDWQGVLQSASNRIEDAAYTAGDPDLPSVPAVDLRALAATWDGQNLFLYHRRTVRNPSSTKVVVVTYIDEGHDGRM